MLRLKKFITKFILSCLVFILLTFSFVPYVHAQEGTWYNQSFQEWFTKVNDSPPNEIFGERYTAAQVQWIIYGLLYFLVNSSGPTGTEALSCLMQKELNQCVDAIKKAFETFSPNNTSSTGTQPWMSVFTTRPISSVTYFLEAGRRLRVVPEAKAQSQGFGFTAAGPVLKLWKVSRDLTYAFLVVVIVAMAFMIMFRVKISPQTVITVQSALPKVILALILITFSYAIAGLLIDIMYVVMGLLAALVVNSGISTFDWQTMFRALTTERNAFMLISFYFSAFLIALFFAFFSGGPIAGILGGALIFLLFPIIMLVLVIVLIITALRILWLLLTTYVSILLQILLAPFQILLGTITPGGGFGAWLRNMLANLAVYPLVATMFLLAFIFLGGAFSALPDWQPLIDFITKAMPFNISPAFLGDTNFWDPPLTFGSGAGGLLWLGASFVIILLIPSAANMIKAVISGQPFAFGTAIGQAIGPLRYPAAYQLAAISEGQIPSIYSRIPFFKEVVGPQLERLLATKRLGRTIKAGAEMGARTLSEGRLPKG